MATSVGPGFFYYWGGGAGSSPCPRRVSARRSSTLSLLRPVRTVACPRSGPAAQAWHGPNAAPRCSAAPHPAASSAGSGPGIRRRRRGQTVLATRAPGRSSRNVPTGFSFPPRSFEVLVGLQRRGPASNWARAIASPDAPPFSGRRLGQLMLALHTWSAAAGCRWPEFSMPAGTKRWTSPSGFGLGPGSCPPDGIHHRPLPVDPILDTGVPETFLRPWFLPLAGPLPTYNPVIYAHDRLAHSQTSPHQLRRHKTTGSSTPGDTADPA